MSDGSREHSSAHEQQQEIIMSIKKESAKSREFGAKQPREQSYIERTLEAARELPQCQSTPQHSPRNARVHPATVEPPMLLSREDLREFCGITYSRWHLQRLIARGLFPAPVALGPEASARKAWRRDEIETWIKGLEQFEYSADHT
jgi:predicted DNA-binding transcriptional regulator AlpA